jgi:hypothetical protein
MSRTFDQETFVYCSVCDDINMRATQKPLLRRIVLEGAKNFAFLCPYRIPLHTNDFRDIHVYIKDKQDADVLFLTGETTVTLLFRHVGISVRFSSFSVGAV